jgi:glycosyltransferase involved in cell wall biosynthesis
MSKAERIIGRAEQLRPRTRQRLAVLVPCFNEEAAIGKVVADFRCALPEAAIYVYDNNSTDGTVEVARAAGALVRREAHQGKGNVVRRMFVDIDADIYVLVDGDATYHAASARTMIARLIEDRLDMVVAVRVAEDRAAYRPGHRSGNRLLTWFFTSVFGAPFTDILSSYRAFSRRFVKSFPVLSRGFEIETEFAVHALELDVEPQDVVLGQTESADGGFSIDAGVRPMPVVQQRLITPTGPFSENCIIVGIRGSGSE